jgi:hypothetical protein
MSRPEQPTKPKVDLTFYPAFCYAASPTWSKWVKLTCWDVHHALRPHQQQGKSYTSGGPSASQTLFYLNHPIQYVQLMGIVVAIEDYFESHFLVTIDDSSGETLDIVLRKPKAKVKAHQQHTITGGSNGVHCSYPTTRSSTAAKMMGTTTASNLASSSDESEADLETAQTSSLLSLLSSLTIASPILAKGLITTFRSVRQLSLLRLSILAPSPHATTSLTELGYIASRTAFLSSSLGKPWRLSDERVKRLRDNAEGERRESSGRKGREARRKKEQREWEERKEETVRVTWDEQERQREAAAEVARRDGEVVMARRKGTKQNEASGEKREVDVNTPAKKKRKR